MSRLPSVLCCLALAAVLTACAEPPRPTVSLYRAVQIGDIDQIKRHLYWEGEAVHRPSPNGDYPLHIAVRQGRVAIAKEMLRHGADPGARNARGHTPLYLALANGRVPSAQLLLDHGAAQDLQATFHELVAARRLDRDALQLLLRHGVEIDAPDADGQTALHRAVSMGDVKLAKRLITAGADVNAPDADGAPPLAKVDSLSDPATERVMRQLLLQYGAAPP